MAMQIKNERSDLIFNQPLFPPTSQTSKVQQSSTSNVQAGNQNNNSVGKPPNVDETEQFSEDQIDIESIRGRFGWTSISDVNIPYIIRKDEKYVSVRIVEQKLLSKYPNRFPDELKKRPPLESHFITIHEAKLLNEINSLHCLYEYGKKEFKVNDLIVLLSDFIEFLNFVRRTFNEKSESKDGSTISKDNLLLETNQIETCGWLQVNNTVTPFVTRINEKYVPVSIMKYAAKINTQGEGVFPTSVECQQLNKMCETAGFKFCFNEGTKIMSLSAIGTHCAICVKVLPKENPLSHVRYVVVPATSLENKSSTNPLSSNQTVPLIPTASTDLMSANPRCTPTILRGSRIAKDSNVGPINQNRPAEKVNTPPSVQGVQGANSLQTSNISRTSESVPQQPVPVTSNFTVGQNRNISNNPTSSPHINNLPGPILNPNAVPYSIENNLNRPPPPPYNILNPQQLPNPRVMDMPARFQGIPWPARYPGTPWTPFVGQHVRNWLNSINFPVVQPHVNKTPFNVFQNPNTDKVVSSQTQNSNTDRTDAARDTAVTRTATTNSNVNDPKSVNVGSVNKLKQSKITRLFGKVTQDNSNPANQSRPMYTLNTINNKTQPLSTVQGSSSATAVSMSVQSSSVAASKEINSPQTVTQANVPKMFNIPDTVAQALKEALNKRKMETIHFNGTSGSAEDSGQNAAVQSVANLQCQDVSSVPLMSQTEQPGSAASSTTTAPIKSVAIDKSANLLNSIKVESIAGKSISCLHRTGKDTNGKFCLVEVICRLYFNGCSVNEFLFTLENVFNLKVFACTVDEEKAFIQYYSLNVTALKCNKLMNADDLENYFPQFSYVFKDSKSEQRKQPDNPVQSSQHVTQSADNSVPQVIKRKAVSPLSESASKIPCTRLNGDTESLNGQRSQPEEEDDDDYSIIILDDD